MDREKFYKYYCENLKMIDRAIDQNAIILRRKIATQDSNEDIYLRQQAFLVGAWLEVQLRKTLYCSANIDTNIVEKVLDAPNKVEEWKTLVNLVFEKHYGKSPPRTQENRINDIQKLINDHFVSLITLRNKLAHGQWAYTFTSDESKVENDYMLIIKKMNILELQWKMSCAKRISKIIYDLTISKSTFDRDFDAHWKGLIDSRKSFENNDYNAYKTSMIKKYENGLKKKQQKNQLKFNFQYGTKEILDIASSYLKNSSLVKKLLRK